MAQARYFDYGFTLTSDAYAFLLSQTFVPGVYQGLDISRGASPDEVVIASGTVLLDDGVVINENQPQTIKFYTGASQQFLVVVRHRLQHIVGGTPADFAVIPYDNLTVWVSGYSYYVIGSVSVRPVGTGVDIVYSSAQKIQDRLAYIIENFSASSTSQSFVAPLMGQRGSQDVGQGVQGPAGPAGVQGSVGVQGPQGGLPTVPYDLSCFIAGQPDVGTLVFAHQAARDFQLQDVDGKLAAVATGNASWELRIDGVGLVGLQWSTGSDTAVITGTLPSSVTSGSIVSLVTTAGTTQPSDIAVTMKGALP